MSEQVQCGRVVAVCRSPGGIPKVPLAEALVTADGIDGDQHAHEKHNRRDRALSLIDLEILQTLNDEGFPLAPGGIGENLTVEGLYVQQLAAGTILQVGEVLMRLEAPRKPCYVLDAVDPRLKSIVVGRCGYMASVIRGGTIRPGMTVEVVPSDQC